ncbi:MAG: hypothetical protein EBX49_10235 [Synechococcaceae bacterium WB8_1B_136]|nr:hypothetical protein [Synechococcaceae bacterium WB8_1B_136]
MAYLLQLCGVSDPLQLFYLEQRSLELVGPAFAGFRPLQLDDLLAWALDAARQRCWDLELIQHTVMEAWLERAEAIRQWQLRLRDEPGDRVLVAGLGSQRDWERRCEAMLRA